MAQFSVGANKHRLGAFERGAPTDHVKLATGREPENFETIALRYAARPEAQRGAGNLLLAVVDFMRIGLTPALDLKKIELDQQHPRFPRAELAARNAAWATEREEIERTARGSQHAIATLKPL